MIEASESERRCRFEVLYRAHYHRVLGYALRRSNGAEAADVVADTFLVAWRRLDEVPDGRRALLWLYGVARRVSANQRRSRRRRDLLTEKARGEILDRVEGSIPHVETGAAAVAFARLRAEEREVLALVAWEGLDAGEVAAVLGCSRNAARVRLHRARRRFMREFECATSIEDRGWGRRARSHRATLMEREESL